MTHESKCKYFTAMAGIQTQTPQIWVRQPWQWNICNGIIIIIIIIIYLFFFFFFFFFIYLFIFFFLQISYITPQQERDRF